MQPLNLRRALWEDRERIAHFNQQIALETEDLALEWERVLSGVSALLKDPNKGFYVIALEQDDIVGQLAVTYEWSDWRNANFWWIQSVYVRSDRRRRAIYSQLHQHIKQLAENDPGVCGLRLYVEEENEVAQSVYHTLGMKRSYYHIMEDAFLYASTKK